MKPLIVIPARMGSKRFPNKPLALIDGKEMILRVVEKAYQACDVVVATPDKVIYDLVRKNGYDSYLTKTDCLTGTDRLCEVADVYTDYNIFINVQGDEPLIATHDIQIVLLFKILCYNVIVNGVCKLCTDDYQNINTVKAYLDKKHYICKLSRKGVSEYKQCGLYAFNREELKAYQNISYEFKKQFLEDNESIEMLLFSYLGFGVKAVEILPTQSVDTKDDIKKVMEVLQNG